MGQTCLLAVFISVMWWMALLFVGHHSAVYDFTILCMTPPYCVCMTSLVDVYVITGCACMTSLVHVYVITGLCADVDECSSVVLNTCQMLCHNKVGGFKCSCLDGYQLNQQDGRTCEGTCSLGTITPCFYPALVTMVSLSLHSPKL